MKIKKAGYHIMTPLDADYILKHLEKAARLCYKSEDKIEDGSAIDMLKRILKIGHESVIEHFSISVEFEVDRGVSHEMVRHRLCSFSQESTRYANYSKKKFGQEITVIEPCFWQEGTEAYSDWVDAMELAERSYMRLLDIKGVKAQEARSVLPNSLKTGVIMTANIREWRHVLKLRCDKPAHPQIREVMLPLLSELYSRVPVLFDDLYAKFYGAPQCASWTRKAIQKLT